MCNVIDEKVLNQHFGVKIPYFGIKRFGTTFSDDNQDFLMPLDPIYKKITRLAVIKRCTRDPS